MRFMFQDYLFIAKTSYLVIAMFEKEKKAHNPTSPFTILEPQNPWLDEFYVAQERRATDFKDQKL